MHTNLYHTVEMILFAANAFHPYSARIFSIYKNVCSLGVRVCVHVCRCMYLCRLPSFHNGIVWIRISNECIWLSTEQFINGRNICLVGLLVASFLYAMLFYFVFHSAFLLFHNSVFG